jgi:hypothetical protein
MRPSGFFSCAPAWRCSNRQPGQDENPSQLADCHVSLLTFPELGTKITASMLAYLSGSIEYAPDNGKSWRAALTPFLRSLGHDVYDPAADEKKNLTDEEVRSFRSWKTCDRARFTATIRKIISWDLDWVESKADYLVVYWDENAQRGAGTGAELTLAHRRGIPAYVVAGMSMAVMSGWILGCATKVFPSFEELRVYLSRKYAAAGEPCGCCQSRH